LNYNQFISYELSSNSYLSKLSNFNFKELFKSTPKSDLIHSYFEELNKINPVIFMNNVNIKWKMLQLAKKDTSIQIPTPSPKKSPTSPKQFPKKPSGSHGYIHNIKRYSPKPSPKISSTKPKTKTKIHPPT